MKYKLIKNYKEVTNGSRLKCQLIRFFTGGVIYPILDTNPQETKESASEIPKNAKKVYSTGFIRESDDIDDGNPDRIALLKFNEIGKEIKNMFSDNLQVADPGGYIIKNQGQQIERSISKHRVRVLESLYI